MSEHYFSVEPESPVRYADVTVRAWGHELVLRSASGVFSYGRLDLGTRVLLRSAQPDPAARSVLDLGSGYGVLAAALGLALPAAWVYAVDVNARALELTRANLAAHGLDNRAQVSTPAAVPPAVKLDEIWSNPPIRIGKPAVHELLLSWLPRLAPTGRAVVVIGRNLGADSYQRWLVDEGWSCERIASAKGFRVLEIRKSTGDLSP